ncbi:hypothetical protein [Salinibacterium sp. PAMC 21357]|uniref:hypothetical protein n=1 Tax=Salinibacterium sp. PAMC 21357 TaxID=1112215 RepID=UPI000287D9DF|nr:hypothetical protein [Salinibacterium sp. PAMC 21357]
MDSELVAMLADVRAATAEIRATTRETQERAKREREESEEASGDIESERRNGDHGKAWQVLQSRIDMSQTTVSDIISGVDHSTEAREVRKQIGQSLAVARELFREGLEEDDSEFQRVQEAQDQLAKTVAQLRELRLEI